METIIIQRDIYERGRDVFAASKFEFLCFEVGEEHRMIEAHQKEDARCLIIGAEQYSSEFFESIDSGSLVLRFGVGYDRVPLAICKKRSLFVANTPGTLDHSVAEHAIALMLNCARKILANDQAVRTGLWPADSGTELKGKTLAILGLGRIGRLTARIAKYGFAMNVVGFGRRPFLDEETSHFVDHYSADLASAVSDADFVSLHLSLTDQTKLLIDKKALSLMSPRAILINTSRGQLIHEGDLYDALSQNLIAGAGLDVFTNEPYRPVGGKDLRKLPNVICTPHISSNTDGANKRMGEACVRNAQSFYDGKWEDLDLVPELT